MPDTVPGQIDPTDQGEGTQPAVLPPAEEPQATGELPEDASERTKREFEKLKEHNKQLADKVSALESTSPRPPSILESYLNGAPPVGGGPMPPVPQVPPAPVLPPMQTPNLPQGRVEAIRQELYDRDGYVNAEELERRFKTAEHAETRAREAENKANSALERVARFEVEAKTAKAKQLYVEFPELDPSNNNYNREFSEAIVDEMLLQLVKTGQQDPVIAAQKLSTRYRQPTAPVAPTQAQQERSQAVASPTGQARPNSARDLELDDLKRRSLHDDRAMEERIRRAGI